MFSSFAYSKKNDCIFTPFLQNDGLMTVEKKTQSQSLPPLRKDVKLFEGPDDLDGSPTYSLYDPVIAKFYKISWQESLAFAYYSSEMDAEALARKIKEKAAIQISAEDIKAFFTQLDAAGLLDIHRDSTYYIDLKEKNTQGWIMWLVYNYLYLRIPLLNPDPFLRRTLKYVEFLGSRPAWIFYMLVSLFGFYLIIERWDAFIHTFTYFFNAEGALYYAIAITATKLIHEFSHAYVAKHYKLYVSSMGAALIVLWPVLYTDVTDGWKLSSRKERFFVSFAGVASELVVAAFATIGWAFSPPGVIQSVCFILATTSLLATLLVNLNPAVRFDGYYMLCDLWGIDNLQTRAFAVTRWKYFDWLFGIKIPEPETGLSPKRVFLMCAYTVYTSIYRIFLYTAIAFFVYYEFTKALGILLFIVEIIIFMIWPIWTELSEFYKMRVQITINKRLMSSLTVIALIAMYFFLPWPHQLTFNAVIVPIKEQIVWVPTGGVVKQIAVKRGQHVVKGQEIAIITSEPLEKESLQADLEKEAAARKIIQWSLHDDTIQYLSQMEEERLLTLEKEAKLKSKKNVLNLRSEIDGVLYEWNVDLKVNQIVAEGAILGKIADFSSYASYAFVSENQVSHFKIGDTVTVQIDYPLTFVPGVITSISPYSSKHLNYPALASTNYGPLPVAEEQYERLDLVDSYYIVEVKIDDQNNQLSNLVRIGQTSHLIMRGPWRSLAAELLHKVTLTLIRESSL